MSITLDNEIIRQIILEHYQNPTYKKNISNNKKDYIILHSKSYNCIDDIYLFLKIENNIIKKCFWNGNSCVITASSTDIMCELVTNKTITEANKIIKEYLNMISGKKFNKKILKEAIVFVNVSKQLARIKCATIGFYALYNKIKENEKKQQISKRAK